ncbi:peptidase S8/S53 domain-containing protein [Nemania sp. NC0429]|nr:peptidase S8/S53 domain-containing protein [Nemania sp. NC0429]
MASKSTFAAKSLPYTASSGQSATSFSNSIQAVAKVIGGIGEAALAIITAESHRGSGSSAGLILPKPTELEGCRAYGIRASRNDLRLDFKSPKGECVGTFQGTMTHAYTKTFDAGPNDLMFWYFSQNKQDIRSSIFSGQIITAGTYIDVHTKKIAHRDTDAFHIVRDGKHFKTNLSPGRYNLHERLNDFYSVVEVIVTEKAFENIDAAGYQIVHATETQPGQNPASSYITGSIKAIHRKTGEATTFSFAEAEHRHFSRFGYINEYLADHIENIPDDAAKVDIVVHGIHQSEPPSETHPSFAAVLSASDIVRDYIQQQGAVINLYPTDEPYLYASLEQLDLANSIAVAKSAQVVVAGYAGEEIHVAVHEYGQYTDTPNAEHDGHSRLTHAIVKNIEPDRPHGHAPGCKLYSANDETNAAVEWALNQDCTVSARATIEATKWPFPTFTLAPGNFHDGDGEKYVNHKSYNSLKVGSHHDNGLEMAATSEYRNPPSDHNDRELPEIAANGTVVSANGQIKSGTSFAAPAVAGVVALIQQMNRRLKRYPEVCRAIVLASANREVVGGTWWGDVAAKVDGRAGAGSIDAECGMDIATQVRCAYALPSSHGWDFGYLASDDFDDNGVAGAMYYIEVPPASKTTAASMSYIAKAALTWNSKVSSSNGRPTSSKLTVDLNLVVRDAKGAIATVSASFDNNYEIVEFYVQPGDTYEVSIVKSSGTPDTRYGIAWSVRNVPWAVRRP